MFFSLDDEEALNSIMKDLAALGRCYTQHNSHKPKNRTLLYKQVCITQRKLKKWLWMDFYWFKKREVNSQTLTTCFIEYWF